MIGINANLTLAGAKRYFCAHKKYHKFVSLMSLTANGILIYNASVRGKSLNTWLLPPVVVDLSAQALHKQQRL
jgi:hypothetical protein